MRLASNMPERKLARLSWSVCCYMPPQAWHGHSGDCIGGRCSQRHALGLQLTDPGIHALLGHVVLIVLVQGEPKELAVDIALGLFMLVRGRVHVSHHLCARLLERPVHLLDGVAEIVAVPLRISAPKHGHRLPAHRKTTYLIQVIVHGGARAVLVSSRVPSGRTDDEAIIPRQILRTHLTQIRRLEARLFANHPRCRFRVACLGGEEEPDRAHRRATAASRWLPCLDRRCKGGGREQRPCCHAQRQGTEQEPRRGRARPGRHGSTAKGGQMTVAKRLDPGELEPKKWLE